MEGKRSSARGVGGGMLGPRLANFGSQGGGELGGWAPVACADSGACSFAASLHSHAVKSVFRVNPGWEENLSLCA